MIRPVTVVARELDPRGGPAMLISANRTGGTLGEDGGTFLEELRITEAMSEPRLREYSSTPPRLKEGELLIAFLAPISSRVHMVSIVIRGDGRFELAERLSGPPGHNSIYHHEHGEIDQTRMTELRAAVARLAAISAEIHGPMAEGLDSDEWETDDRRSLAFWHAGERDGCAVRAEELYQRFGLPSSKVGAYRQQLDAVWRLILPLLEFPLFKPHAPLAGETWSFPLESIGAREADPSLWFT